MKNIVVLSGAGISAESGLKTFRDSDGLWENYKVEDVATINAWHADPGLVLRFYNERRLGVLNAAPNQAHILLADLQSYYDVHIITQNIDDLHERAGSKNVLHLHGEINKMRSVKNENKLYPSYEVIDLGDLAEDGGQLRPHIVWFGEAVPMMIEAISLVENADLLVIVGTSLQVYPAAGLLDYAPGNIKKYIIDKNIPPVDRYENLHSIHNSATAGVKELYDILIQEI
jgi:NAD-dependent deacetylase